MAFMDYLLEQFRRANPQQGVTRGAAAPAPQQPPQNAMAQNTDPSVFQQLAGMFTQPQQPLPDGSQNLQQREKKGGLFSALLKAFAGGM